MADPAAQEVAMKREPDALLDSDCRALKRKKTVTWVDDELELPLASPAGVAALGAAQPGGAGGEAAQPAVVVLPCDGMFDSLADALLQEQVDTPPAGEEGEGLSRRALLERRLARTDQLVALYQGELWGLLEELRLRHLQFQAQPGLSLWKQGPEGADDSQDSGGRGVAAQQQAPREHAAAPTAPTVPATSLRELWEERQAAAAAAAAKATAAADAQQGKQQAAADAKQSKQQAAETKPAKPTAAEGKQPAAEGKPGKPPTAADGKPGKQTAADAKQPKQPAAGSTKPSKPSPPVDGKASSKQPAAGGAKPAKVSPPVAGPAKPKDSKQQQQQQEGKRDGKPPQQPTKKQQDAAAPQQQPAPKQQQQVPTPEPAPPLPRFEDVEALLLSGAAAALPPPDEAAMVEQRAAFVRRLELLGRLEESALGAACRQLDALGGLALLCGRRARYVLRRSAVALGRCTESHGKVDVDLSLEAPAGAEAQRISRQQAQLFLDPEGFRLRCTGRRTMAVNGRPLSRGQTAALPSLSLVQAGGVALLFVANTAAVARAAARSAQLAV